MGEDGKVFKNSYDKFRQINKYLEFIDDTIREMQSKKLIEKPYKSSRFWMCKILFNICFTLLFK